MIATRTPSRPSSISGSCLARRGLAQPSLCRNEPAILALDEAFAEFDRYRSRLLLSLLSKKGQVFLASADEKEFGSFYSDMRVFGVDNGVVKEK